jgi:hypothetical protein
MHLQKPGWAFIRVVHSHLMSSWKAGQAVHQLTFQSSQKVPLSSSVPLSGILIFTLNRGKEIVTEAGVPPSPLIRNFSIPVLFDETAFDTGLAVFNIQGVKTVLDLRVRKSDGEVVFRKTVTLSPYEHLPLFATQLFPELSQLGQFEGVIEAASDQAVAVIAMKLTGHVLTTFPVSKSN